MVFGIFLEGWQDNPSDILSEHWEFGSVWLSLANAQNPPFLAWRDYRSYMTAKGE